MDVYSWSTAFNFEILEGRSTGKGLKAFVGVKMPTYDVKKLTRHFSYELRNAYTARTLQCVNIENR